MSETERLFQEFDAPTRLTMVAALQSLVAFGGSDTEADDAERVLIAAGFTYSASASRAIRERRRDEAA